MQEGKSWVVIRINDGFDDTWMLGNRKLASAEVQAMSAAADFHMDLMQYGIDYSIGHTYIHTIAQFNTKRDALDFFRAVNVKEDEDGMDKT